MQHEILDWKNPDYGPVYEERAKRLQALLAGGPETVAAVKAYYKTHPVEWIEDWGMTYDPRKILSGTSPYVPFMLFPRQRELIEFWHQQMADRKDSTCEKSRDTGISWCIAAFAAWAWCTLPGASIGIGSYERDKVDQLGVPDSLIEKVRIMIRNLPMVLRPAGLDLGPKGHLMFMRLVNPETGSTITGEVGDNIGRGARATLYFVDEAAHLQHAELADASLANTADCKVFASTAFGQGQFYKKIKSGMFPNFRFHWKGDPRKDDAWYRDYKNKFGDVITAQEVDIDHEASVEDICIPVAWVNACRELTKMLKPDKAHYSGVAGLDVADGGGAKSVFVSRFGPIVEMPEARATGDTTTTAFWAMRLSQKMGTALLNFDSVGVGAGVASTLRNNTATVKTHTVVDRPPMMLAEKEPETIAEMVAWSFKENNPEPEPDPAAPKRGRTTKLQASGINVGIPASKFLYWADGRTHNEMFANVKAAIWWLTRDRAQKSYEHWLALIGDPEGRLYDESELLLLPDHDKLCSELSTVKYEYVGAGKIGIESKKKLRTRGVASPDHAEATVLTLVPERPKGTTGTVEGFYG